MGNRWANGAPHGIGTCYLCDSDSLSIGFPRDDHELPMRGLWETAATVSRLPPYSLPRLGHLGQWLCK